MNESLELTDKDIVASKSSTDRTSQDINSVVEETLVRQKNEMNPVIVVVNDEFSNVSKEADSDQDLIELKGIQDNDYNTLKRALSFAACFKFTQTKLDQFETFELKSDKVVESNVSPGDKAKENLPDTSCQSFQTLLDYKTCVCSGNSERIGRYLGTEKHNKYTMEDVYRLIDLVCNQKLSIRKSAAKLNMPVSTATSWIRTDKKIKEAAAAKGEVTQEITHGHSHRCHFNEEHRVFIMDLYTQEPRITIPELLEKTFKAFDQKFSYRSMHYFVTRNCGIVLSQAKPYFKKRNTPDAIKDRYEWASTYDRSEMNYKENCVFIEECYLMVKRSDTLLKKNERKSYRQKYMVAISAKGLINFESIKNRGDTVNIDATVDPEYYSNFIERTVNILSEIDTFKNSYIVLPNRNIVNSRFMKTVEDAGYTTITLPKYSRELNPARHFWQTIKFKVEQRSLNKRRMSSDERLIRATKLLLLQDWEVFCNYALENIKKCLSEEPIY